MMMLISTVSHLEGQAMSTLTICWVVKFRMMRVSIHSGDDDDDDDGSDTAGDDDDDDDDDGHDGLTLAILKHN